MSAEKQMDSLLEIRLKRDLKIFVLTGLIAVVFVLGSVNSVFASNVIGVSWDHPKYYLDHGFQVTIDDSLDPNKNVNTANGYIPVSLKSLGLGTTNSYQIPYTGSNYLYKSTVYVTFVSSTGVTDSTHFRTNAADPSASDTIELWYAGAKQSFTTVQGNDDNKLTSDSATTPQPTYSTKITCAAGDGPTNGDGICDSWKTSTPGYLSIPLNGVTYLFPCPSGDTCNDTTKKDLYVEVDAMQDQMPPQAAFNAIKTVFLNANPSIRLHFVIDEEFPMHALTTAQISTPPAIGEFEWYKHMYFGTASERITPNCTTPPNCGNVGDELTAKRQVFHYMLFINKLPGSSSTGYSERPGNDMEIALGPLNAGYGSLDDNEGTIMHELGHNLGLYHGGYTSDLNCKPNYPSVMSYSRQLSTFFARPLDYSYGLAATLAQGSLSEPAGIGGTGMTVFGPTTAITTSTGVPTNYNPASDSDTTQTGMTQEFYNIPSVGCTTTHNPPYNMLDSADWSHLIFTFKNYNGFGSGVGGTDSSNTDMVEEGIPTSYTQSQVPSVQQVSSHITNHSLIREIDYKVDPQSSVYNPPTKIDPTSTISDAKNVIKKVTAVVKVEFNDAITDFNNVMSDQEKNITSAKTLTKLNKIKTDVLGNLTNAQTNTIQDLDNVFSGDFKVNKIQLIQNASWTADTAFTNGTASIDYYLNDANGGIEYDNAKEDLKQQLLDSIEDIDKQIIAGRDAPSFQKYMDAYPDGTTWPPLDYEISSTKLTDARASLVDALISTVQNKSLIYDDKNGLYKDLNDTKGLIKGGYLTDASQSLSNIFTKINSFEIPQSGDHAKNLQYKKMALGQINNMMVTFQVASAVLPTDRQYSPPYVQLIEEWLLLLIIAIILAIAVWAVVAQMQKKKVERKHKKHMEEHHFEYKPSGKPTL